MPSNLSTHRNIAIIVSAVGILSACGLPLHDSPPYPPPPQRSGLTVTPAKVSFEITQQQRYAPEQTITLLNTASVPLTLQAIYMAVRNSGFDLAKSDCPAVLPASGTCTLTVGFDSGIKGLHRNLLIIAVQDYLSEGVSLEARQKP